MFFLDQSFILVYYVSFICENNRVPVARDGQIELASRLHMNIKVVGRSSSVDGACFALPFSRDDLDLNFVLIENFYFVAGKFLVCWGIHLVCASEIDP